MCPDCGSIRAKQATAGNGQATAPSAKPKPAPVDDGLEIPPSLKREAPKPKPVDPELDELPVSASDDLDDEIPF
jgi:hypothetical protein